MRCLLPDKPVLRVDVEHVSGWSYEVVIYADDKLVMRSHAMASDRADQEANKIRGLLGLNHQYVVYYTVKGNIQNQRVEVPSIKDASAWANANCPDGTTKIEVYEAE